MTLLELMTVLAIVAIIAGLAAYSLRGLTDRTAAQNASHDLFSALQVARSRAMQTGKDVWFIVYPNGGPPDKELGAYYIFEDNDGAFGDPASAFNFRNHFSPTNLSPAGGATTGRLFSKGVLAEYASGTVSFGFNGRFSFGPPFASLNPTTNPGVACSFCRPVAPFSAAARGAIVFNGDGAARFVDNNGILLDPHPRSASFALVSNDQLKATLFAISASTGFIAQYTR